MLDVNKEVLGHLGAARDLRAAAFVLMCAERVMPLITTCGGSSSITLVESILGSMWKMLAGEAFDSRLAEQSVRALPEASLDDSHDPAYYAMLALALVDDAIHAMNCVTPALAISASEGALDLARDLESHVRDITERAYPLEELEGSAQIEAAERLGSLCPEDLPGALASLRDLARQRSSAFAKAAQTIASAWP